VRNAPGKRQLNAKQLNALLQSLRDKTGLLDLYFAEDGFLTIADPAACAGGSATARALLLAALNGAQAFDLEAHNRSQAVAFARLPISVKYLNRRSGAEIDVQPLEIDFTDFVYLRGDSEVLSAFDLGLVVLHELAHGVLLLPDRLAGAEGAADPGPCEEYINRIRRELNLPERQTYSARLRQGVQTPASRAAQLAELVFIRSLVRNGRTKQEYFYLQWEAAAVGLIKPREAIIGNTALAVRQ
jgi:hypothetical protein